MNGIERTLRNRYGIGIFLLAAGVLLGACSTGNSADLAVPDAQAVEGYYSYPGGLEARVSGNVAEITVTQPADQLRRGGTLWAKVGPYVLLFTQETHQLFEDYPGLAGVRVVTRASRGPEVARALLRRDALTGVQWRRSLNIAGRARREGTERVPLLEDLVDWGEEHTDFEYNERYIRR